MSDVTVTITLVEDCGCKFDTSGYLIEGCRRHDPQVAGRIVAALEDRIRVAWRAERVWSRRAKENGGGIAAPEDWRLRTELRTLLRIRRAGRTP